MKSKAICYLLVFLMLYVPFAKRCEAQVLTQSSDDTAYFVVGVALAVYMGLIIWMGVSEAQKKAKRSKGRLSDLELGMTKRQVQSIMDKPSEVRGEIVNKYEQVITVWQYDLYQEDNNWTTAHWLYFCNGRLVQFGRAGDWQREADRIYEMRFR